MPRRRRQRLRTLALVGVGLALTGVTLVAYEADLLRRPDLDTVDQRFSIRGTERPQENVALVAIDDVTFGELGVRWPFPRRYHARVIDRLRRDKAKVIAYDVQFTEPSDNPRDDLALFEAIGRAVNVVLGTTEVDERGRTNILGGDANLREIAATPANALLPNDPGGVVRRLSHSVAGLETLGVATAEAASGRTVEPAELGGRTTWIDYAGPAETIASVPFSRVYEGRTRPGRFRDKIVLVGPTAPSLQDVHPTSTADLMSGIEIQANATSTVLRRFPLKDAPGVANVGLIVLLGLAASLVSLLLSPLRALAVVFVVGAAFLVGAQLAFNEGRIVPVVYPLAALSLGYVGSLGVHYFTEVRERHRLRMLFSRFVPEQVVDDVVDRADDDLRLGGVELDCTVLFSDIRGFTTFSELQPARHVIEVLNRYLAEMSDAILTNGGTLLAYLGDGIMAVFGAPIEQPDHADRALSAAREMVGERLERFNSWLRDQGVEGFHIGVGLNSGPVMSGNVGSLQRLEYTAIGDTVNTAARLEQMTKGTSHQLYLAEATRSLLRSNGADLVYVDELAVRGRKDPVKVWALSEEQSRAGN